MGTKKQIYNLDISATQAFVDDLKAKKVLIYGAGKIGKRLNQSLIYFGIGTAIFWDKNASIIKKVDGKKVVEPQPESLQDKDAYFVIVTIFSENVSRMIGDGFQKAGLKNITYDQKKIKSLIYFECWSQIKEKQFIFDYKTCHICPVSKNIDNPCDIFSDYVARNQGITDSKLKDNERFVVSSMGVLVTNRCNLTCEGCNHFRDLYTPSDNIVIEKDAILYDLSKVIESVDFIEKVVIVGGEAFVHKDIYEIISRVMNLPKIGIVEIITNGTILPKDDRIFDLLASDNRVVVEISGYGDNIAGRLQNNVKAYLAKLEHYKISHQYLEVLEWFDFGGFEHRGFSKEEHRRIYKTCCFISNDLFDGKLYKCSRSVFGARLGKIPDYPADYVDVRATSSDNLRSKLIAFIKNEYPAVCQHCNGTSEERIPAGFQVRKKIARKTTQSKPFAEKEFASL